MNIIDESGILAISTRLQRLSDQLRKDGTLIYKAFNIDFEPKWFPVIYTLHHKPEISVVELAAEIGYAHPSTISLLKELEKEKLIESKKDANDERKRLLKLSSKGRALVTRMQPVWLAMTDALKELTDTQNNLMKAIDEVEEQFAMKGFYERVKRKI
ncbi:DNA-binding transcriptional regulator, MarR family [Chitinophaga sp. YR627]|uniref:MarR family winged helix-turn-helix transcriptional regulator n=1 Tax=Chitinophaga sp. YR627 TaxID=1881041 RepID=UPI0008F0FC77|nr:MarR family winged helix-turn-helix transcriptional regulator [Chitinophaga sp. YR627]SFM80134.1 DNA-binding transcriptional regulator, MarR family [Chitinophaga sp. YR627]